MRLLMFALLLTTHLLGGASVKIGDLYYNIDNANKTAEVTYQSRSSSSNSSYVSGDLVIPSSIESNGNTYWVASIGNSAFAGCSGLTSVTIGSSVTTIGDDAFNNCSGLTSVTIPDSVTSIGDYAFSECSSLKSVTIPNSVTTIGNYAFDGCSNLTSVHITDIAAWCKIIFSNRYSNPLCYAHSLYINRRKVKDIVIPDSVTSIGDYAFYRCSDLTSVTIPNSVITIGKNAFGYCSGLTSVTIPNAVKSIGISAFYKCSGLKSASIGESVASIGDYAFYECTGLTLEIIPDSVTTIGDEAFHGCNGIKSINIGNSVKSIGEGAFSVCGGLTSVTIPSSVTSIGRNAFEQCFSLKSLHITDLAAWCKIKFGNSYSNPLFYAHSLYINGTGIKDLVIPDSVTSIGDYAFSECSSLKSVTIPSSLASIGYTSFTGCTNLSSVYSYAETPPVMYEDAFSEATYQAATLYVPNGCANVYKDDAVWYLFNTIVEGEYVSGVDDIIAGAAASVVTDYYNLHGVRSAEPWSGMNIVVYSDGTRRKAVY